MDEGALQADSTMLTAREREIMDLVCQGKINKVIADVLHISPYTIKNHICRILVKMKAHNRAHAAALYVRSFESTQEVS